MPDSPSVNAPDASPRHILIDWANAQDAWVRAMCAEVMATGRPLDETTIEKVFEIFRSEKGLSAEAMPDIPVLSTESSAPSEEQSLRLDKLSGLVGVNALEPGSDLEFNPRLTILWGQNGAGKTGYARVLKRMAAVRTAQDILGNAHDPGATSTPSATITYTIDDQQHSVVWENQLGLPPLTRMSVFDAPAANLHVDEELGYVFTPADLALFEHLATSLRRMQERISAESGSLRPTGNPLLSLFERGTKVYPLVETLGATTQLQELDALASVPDDIEAQIVQLTDEVAALRGQALDALVENADIHARQLTRLANVSSSLSRFDAKAYQQAVSSLQAAAAQRDAARVALFESADSGEPADDVWQAFIAAADVYRQHIGRHQYPQQGDTCLYCGQTLGDAAIALVTKYREFLDEATQQAVVTATEAVHAASLSVSESDIQAVSEFLSQHGSHDDPWLSPALVLIETCTAAVTATQAGQPVDEALPTLAQEVASLVEPALQQAREVLSALTEQRDNRAVTLAAKQSELREIAARRDLSKHIETARSQVQRAREAQQLDGFAKAIGQRLIRSLTEQTKRASEDLVNRSFTDLFAEECEALGAPKVALEFQGRSGRAERKKVVASYRPSAVLSEGEQKVLALADFLAESRMRGTQAPIVFDDPVTSLDYRRLDEVARRIVKLSDTHQVVVLTHNVMFASALIADHQKKTKRVTFYEVRDSGKQKGVLAADVEPRLDTPKDIEKRLNARVASAEKADAETQDALIASCYDLLRSWCEAFVEQELLQSVTQRYRANVMMTKLGDIKIDKLRDAIAVIEPLFDKACGLMSGHSQPAEFLNAKPTLEDFKADWEIARAARDSHLAP